MKLRLVRRNDDDERLMADLDRLAQASTAADLDVEPPIGGTPSPADRDPADRDSARDAGRLTSLRRRLVRDNAADPRVMADLARLAGGTLAAAPIAERGTNGALDRPAPTDPVRRRLMAGETTAALADDAFVVTVSRLLLHLRRFLSFYAVTAAWLVMMLAVQPHDGAGRSSNFASSGGPAPSGSDNTVTAAAPGASTGTAIDAGVGVLYPDLTPTPAGDGPATFAYEAPKPTSTAPATTSPTTSGPAEPVPLRITESGYASRAGGTPLEREPADGGLPVTVAGGSASRYSYFRLAGTATTLVLREGSDNVNATAAAVRLCPITTPDWTPRRGAAMTNAPAYEGPCVTGVRSAQGLWSWDLSTFAFDPGRTAGFALVPPGNDPTQSYQVVFVPIAVSG